MKFRSLETVKDKWKLATYYGFVYLTCAHSRYEGY